MMWASLPDSGAPSTVAVGYPHGLIVPAWRVSASGLPFRALQRISGASRDSQVRRKASFFYWRFLHRIVETMRPTTRKPQQQALTPYGTPIREGLRQYLGSSDTSIRKNVQAHGTAEIAALPIDLEGDCCHLGQRRKL